MCKSFVKHRRKASHRGVDGWLFYFAFYRYAARGSVTYTAQGTDYQISGWRSDIKSGPSLQLAMSPLALGEFPDSQEALHRAEDDEGEPDAVGVPAEGEGQQIGHGQLDEPL